MKRQHQFHSVLAAKYFKIAGILKSRMGSKPDADQIKAYNDYYGIGVEHERIARLFPECNEFAPS